MLKGKPHRSFLGDTLILLADETEKRIDKIAPGEIVLCFDEHGDIYRGRVTKVFVEEVREYFVLDFGFEKLSAAGRQRLWTDHGWETVEKILEGCYIKEYRNGWHERAVRYKSRVRCARPVKMYSLEITGRHTYFAGRKAAHNAKNIND